MGDQCNDVFALELRVPGFLETAKVIELLAASMRPILSRSSQQGSRWPARFPLARVVNSECWMVAGGRFRRAEARVASITYFYPSRITACR
jgi:hypothetical protein